MGNESNLNFQKKKERKKEPHSRIIPGLTWPSKQARKGPSPVRGKKGMNAPQKTKKKKRTKKNRPTGWEKVPSTLPI